MSRSNVQAVIDWRKRTKQRIVDAMGAKCSECGYSSCVDALELHHLEPSNKKFSFGGIRARPRSWKTIVEELKKCIMVCANCHREIEAGVRVAKNTRTTFNVLFEEYTPLNKFSHQEKEYKYKIVCKSCNKTFKAYRPTAKFCSEMCRSK